MTKFRTLSIVIEWHHVNNFSGGLFRPPGTVTSPSRGLHNYSSAAVRRSLNAMNAGKTKTVRIPKIIRPFQYDMFFSNFPLLTL